MSTGGDDEVMARIGLDASAYGAGVEEMIRYARRIEDEQRKTDRAIEESARRRFQMERDLTRAVSEGRLDDANRIRRAIEANERRMGDAVEDSYRRQGRAAEDTARAVERAARRAAEAQEREAARSAAQAEAMARRAAEAQEREARRASAALEREARKAAEAQERAAMRAGDAQQGQLAGVGRLALQAAVAVTGLGSAFEGVQLYASGLADMARDMERLAEGAVSFRDRTAETGSVLGIYGNELKETILRFQAESTLETPERAEEFLRSFSSAMEIPMMRGTLDEQGFEALQLKGAQYAASEGLPAGEFADLLGLIATQQQGPVDPDRTLAEADQVVKTLYAGIGDLKLLPQLREFAGANVDEQGNLLGSVAEAAAMVAVTSLAGEGSAGQRAEILFRSVVAGLSRQRNVSGAEDTQGRFLRHEVGIESTDDPLSRTEKLFGYLQRNAPEGVPLDEYLVSKGFGQSQERSAIAALMKNARAGDLDRMIGQARAAAGGAGIAGVDASIARRLGEDEAMATRAGAMGELTNQRLGSQAVPLEALTDLFLAARPPESRSLGGRIWDDVRARATFSGMSGEEFYRDSVRGDVMDALQGAVYRRGLVDEAREKIGGDYNIIAGAGAMDRGWGFASRGRPEGLTDQLQAVALIQTLRDAGVDPTAIAADIAGSAPGVVGAGTSSPAREQLEENRRTNDLLGQIVRALSGRDGGPPPANPPGGFND